MSTLQPLIKYYFKKVFLGLNQSQEYQKSIKITNYTKKSFFQIWIKTTSLLQQYFQNTQIIKKNWKDFSPGITMVPLVEEHRQCKISNNTSGTRRKQHPRDCCMKIIFFISQKKYPSNLLCYRPRNDLRKDIINLRNVFLCQNQFIWSSCMVGY